MSGFINVLLHETGRRTMVPVNSLTDLTAYVDYLPTKDTEKMEVVGSIWATLTDGSPVMITETRNRVPEFAAEPTGKALIEEMNKKILQLQAQQSQGGNTMGARR